MPGDIVLHPYGERFAVEVRGYIRADDIEEARADLLGWLDTAIEYHRMQAKIDSYKSLQAVGYRYIITVLVTMVMWFVARWLEENGWMEPFSF